jgi:putative addiction module component (TIGR02574 family)
MHPEPEDLRQLPIAEKLRRVQQLWDEIAASGERFPLPEWHREEAERRARELEADPSIAIAREDLWRRVDDANG